MVISVSDSLILQGQVRIADALSFITTSAGAKLIDQRVTDWTNTITHEFTVSWIDEATKLEFFNKGGQIRLSCDRVGGAGTDQNASRTNLLDKIGTVIFNLNGTYGTGSLGVNSAIGSLALTNSFQSLFSGTSTDSQYSTDDYTIDGRNISVNQISFNISQVDASDQAFDEITNGTITSYIDERRHISTVSPVYSTTVSMVAGT